MPIPRLIQLQSWSYSRYTDYDQCPFLAKQKYIVKLPEPDSPAKSNGEAVHKLSAQYLTAKGKVEEPPEVFSRFGEEYVALRKLKPPVQVEQSWTFDRDWEACEWNAWDRAWLRLKVDIHYVYQLGTKLKIIDVKTGKVDESHERQRSLYALGGLLTYPKVKTVECEHWYLAWGIAKKNTWKRKDLNLLQKEWKGKIELMLNDTEFLPRPGRYCSWCAYRKEIGGPCVYG